jgi:fructoselysine-6-P-deglycase FrlB-like protein
VTPDPTIEPAGTNAGLPHVVSEIRRQPEAWTRAAALAGELSDTLPRRGARVAVIGCGTSWFVAAAYAALREQAGLGETDAFAASELPLGRRYDVVLAISRSGTTTEVVRALAGTAAQTLVITAVPDSPVTEVATASVVLDFADETSIVQTVFATSALMLLRASLGEALSGVVEQGVTVLAGGLALPEEVVRAEQYTFLGQGWADGIAREAALKMREAAQLWTESYPQMEYRHGPIAIAQPGRVVWVFGTPVPGLLDDLTPTGVHVVADALDPVADLVRAQLLAVRRAADLGLDPDRPRSLSRSVVLAP